MSLYAQTIKTIESSPLIVPPFIKTRALNAEGMKGALELFGFETLGSQCLDVLSRAEFTPTFGLQFRFIIIRPEIREPDGSIKFHRAMEIAESRGYIRPTFEAGFYLAEWLIENRGDGFDFEHIIIMHEPVCCGEGSSAGNKILGVFDNLEVRGVLAEPGYGLSGDTVFAYQLPRHFR